jgi:hypothetical protein
MKSLDHVPFIVTGDKGALELAGEQGTLADVAPTVLAILGLPQPEGEFRDLIRSRPDGTSRDDWSFSSRQAIDASAERHQIAIDVHRCKHSDTDNLLGFETEDLSKAAGIGPGFFIGVPIIALNTRRRHPRKPSCRGGPMPIYRGERGSLPPLGSGMTDAILGPILWCSLSRLPYPQRVPYHPPSKTSSMCPSSIVGSWLTVLGAAAASRILARFSRANVPQIREVRVTAKL